MTNSLYFPVLANMLQHQLKSHKLSRFAWPSKREQQEYASRVQEKYPLIEGRFGFVDGKNFKVQEPSSEIDLQNAMYNGRLHSALITGVLCFSVDGLLIWAKHNCVGSWNDGDMSRELQEKLIDEHYCDEE
jgi:hypothetical protein